MSAPASNTLEIKPVAASLFMLGACSMFAFNSIFVKLAADTGLHPFQIAFFRNFFALLIILPMVLATSGTAVLRPNKPGMLAFRGLLNGSSMMCWFYAVPLMAITDLTAIGFTGPIWATLLAAIFLGEKMKLRRWTAIFVGILGALIVVRPGFQEVNSAVYLVLFSSATWGATLIVIRRLTSVEHINTILVYQALAMTVIAFVPMLFVWQMPTWEGLGLDVGPWRPGHGCPQPACARVLHAGSISATAARLRPLPDQRCRGIPPAWRNFKPVDGAWCLRRVRCRHVHLPPGSADPSHERARPPSPLRIQRLISSPPSLLSQQTSARNLCANHADNRRQCTRAPQAYLFKTRCGRLWGPNPNYLYATAKGQAAPGLQPRRKRRWGAPK